MSRTAVLLALLAVGPGRAAPPEAATVLVIHGGAGVLTDAELKAANVTPADYERELARALHAGYRVWEAKRSSVDAVEAAIRVMEDCELFNAGRGAVLTHDGRAELDASIMEGAVTGAGEGKADPRKPAGAVAGVWHIKNPISAARAVMESDGPRPVLLTGDGAERFVFDDEARRTKYRIERVSNVYFWTPRRLAQIREAVAKGMADTDRRGDRGGADRRFGTVGAVARDRAGRLAAGTSTGGLGNKLPGRVGDSPVIGAGTYADDRACGVSCTGTGELFIRHAVAHDVAARMLYGKATVEDAARQTMADLPDEPGGVGGLIALDKDGRHTFALSAKCPGMYRGYVTEAGEFFVGDVKGGLRKVTPPGDGK